MHVSFRPYIQQPKFRGGILPASQLALSKALSILPGISADDAEKIILASKIELGTKSYEYKPHQVGELDNGEVYVITKMNDLNWQSDKNKHFQVYMGTPPLLNKLTIFSTNSYTTPIRVVAWNSPDSPSGRQVSFDISNRGELAPKVNDKAVKGWITIIE